MNSCPFTENNVAIRVNFVSQCKFAYPQPGEVKYMSFMDGEITYMAENSRLLGDLCRIRTETLDFARRLALPFPDIKCSR